MEDLCNEIIKKYPDEDLKTFDANTRDKIIMIFQKYYHYMIQYNIEQIKIVEQQFGGLLNLKT